MIEFFMIRTKILKVYIFEFFMVVWMLWNAETDHFGLLSLFVAKFVYQIAFFIREKF